MSNTESSDARRDRDRVDLLIERVAGDIDSNDPGVRRSLRRQVEQAAEWLVKNHPHCEWPDETLVTLLRLLLPRLKGWITGRKVNAFFSYKAKHEPIASEVARKLEIWSAGKLKINHMADLASQVGRDWRAKIEAIIRQCDWFLLLLPIPGDERDWVLYEAGYFSGCQALAGRLGRLVCLHHPDTEVSDALGARESVPAEVGPVRAFLEALFKSPNWIPGLPPLNPGLNQLDDKATEIVALIKSPTGPSVKLCCGPHMEVTFEDASAVTGWEQLERGSVIASNEDCRRLFGLEVYKPLFGDWVREVLEGDQDREWITQLACAVQAIGEGRQVPPIDASFRLADGRRVRPRICAVRRRKMDQSVESIDILFFDAELPIVTVSMKPELAALAITLEYVVRYRHQLLEPFADRKLELKDVEDFQNRQTALFHRALRQTLQGPVKDSGNDNEGVRRRRQSRNPEDVRTVGSAVEAGW